MSVGLVDSHCHLSDRRYDSDRDAVIERARAAGLTHLVAVGGGGPIADSEASYELAKRFGFMRSTAGIHPHDAKSYDDGIEARIAALLEKPEVVAVGETGLDYYYEHSPRPAQRDALARHIALALSAAKPIVLHCRDADDDLRQVLSSEAPGGLRGVVHCFTGDYRHASWYLDYGLLVSFSGILCFPKSQDLRNTAARLPLERLMVETDSPYLAPPPHRGRRNEPAFVAQVAETLAAVHDVSIDAVVEATARNAAALFSLS